MRQRQRSAGLDLAQREAGVHVLTSNGNTGEFYSLTLDEAVQMVFKSNSKLFRSDAQFILAAIKEWTHHPDNVLSTLSKMIIDRQLFKIEIQKKEFSETENRLFCEITSLRISKKKAHHPQTHSLRSSTGIFTSTFKL